MPMSALPQALPGLPIEARWPHAHEGNLFSGGACAS